MLIGVWEGSWDLGLGINVSGGRLCGPRIGSKSEV